MSRRRTSREVWYVLVNRGAGWIREATEPTYQGIKAIFETYQAHSAYPVRIAARRERARCSS